MTETKAPRGVSGKQHQLFCSLTESQRQTYRYYFDVCGMLAGHCYKIATGEHPEPFTRTI